MADITCPMCQKQDRVEVLVSTSKKGAEPGGWCCCHCRHGWRTEPWKTSDAVTFFKNVSYVNIKNAKELDATKTKLFERFLRLAEELKPQPPRTMVDFGCSYGTVLQLFREHDWQVMGIEISPTAQKVLDEQNLPWAPCMEETGLAPESVDIVVMSDSIYYLPEPVATLRTIRSYMQEDGLLLLRQPTRGGLVHLLAHIYRKKALAERLWLDHVHLFSRRSTALALERAGFCNIRFFREKDFRRSVKTEIIHHIIRALNFMSLRFFDLSLSWTVVAKAGKH